LVGEVVEEGVALEVSVGGLVTVAPDVNVDSVTVDAVSVTVDVMEAVSDASSCSCWRRRFSRNALRRALPLGFPDIVPDGRG